MLDTRFGSIWSQLWRHRFNADSAEAAMGIYVAWQKEWADAFAKEELTVAQVKMAIHHCRRREMPPTLPEFLDMAKPIADAEEAFIEAGKQMAAMSFGHPFVWHVPAIYWAAHAFGAFELRNTNFELSGKRWKRLLDEQMRRGYWAPVPVYDADVKWLGYRPDRDQLQQKFRSAMAVLHMPPEEKSKCVAKAAQQLGRAA
ncbi:hypothetical protein FNU76_10260 [Chitinimonas arctica]|uniref:Uncharacterized protein n=2 Tax=Chitinimonas arctica TaxID=2594795 RepID=A0A516SEX9_9NEIS|nr:hypothetical protein FNU76_10260 [Chitinimonas arctica]